jgi:formylglycine-generating enzyme required for sulfatase activity
MWNPATKKRLRQALTDVYPKYRLLEIFVAEELGERLTVITHEQGLIVVVFDLIDWAERSGRIDELYEKFCQENPHYKLEEKLGLVTVEQPLPDIEKVRLSRFRAQTVRVDETGKIIERQTIKPEYFTEVINGVVIEMVSISGGTFWMGSPKIEAKRNSSESPQHEVNVASFFIGKFAVTRAQWRAVAELRRISRSLNPNPSKFKGSNRPVVNVNWDEAQEFCARLAKATGKAYRLPTEAEWEYAACAGTTTPFAYGATLSTAITNYDGDYTYGNGEKGEYRGQTVDVGSFPPNAWGLYEMHGNVWEWNEDSWHENYNGVPTDGTARIDTSTGNKLLRGGAWDVIPRYCRSAYRDADSRDGRSVDVGFRVLCVSPKAL